MKSIPHSIGLAERPKYAEGLADIIGIAVTDKLRERVIYSRTSIASPITIFIIMKTQWWMASLVDRHIYKGIRKRHAR
jgi:hypothetical protein